MVALSPTYTYIFYVHLLKSPHTCIGYISFIIPHIYLRRLHHIIPQIYLHSLHRINSQYIPIYIGLNYVTTLETLGRYDTPELSYDTFFIILGGYVILLYIWQGKSERCDWFFLGQDFAIQTVSTETVISCVFFVLESRQIQNKHGASAIL